MKAMGIDASSSCTGVTVVDDGNIICSEIWKPVRKSDHQATRLLSYYLWLEQLMAKHKPKAIGVSATSKPRNHRTTRVLGRYEGVSILAGAQRGIDVVDVRDMSARKTALGKGVNKEDAYDIIIATFPDFPWLPFDEGGADQADSAVIALSLGV